jgi:hypothetical protein
MIATPPFFSEVVHSGHERFRFRFRLPAYRSNMSPLYDMARLVARASIETTHTGTYDGRIPPTRILIQKDSIAPKPNTAEASAAPTNRGMPATTKIGLAMIPVAVVVVGLYVLFLFRWRKRRTARKEKRLSISPPVPEKDTPTYPESVKSNKRSSKVYTMSAFAAPLHDGRHREAHFPGLAMAQSEAESMSEEEDVQVQMTKTPRTSRTLLEVPIVDSPTDRGSPFRLKRGNTLRRMSLGPELTRLFPTPPTAARLRPVNANEGQPESTIGREEAVYQHDPMRHQQ